MKWSINLFHCCLYTKLLKSIESSQVKSLKSRYKKETVEDWFHSRFRRSIVKEKNKILSSFLSGGRRLAERGRENEYTEGVRQSVIPMSLLRFSCRRGKWKIKRGRGCSKDKSHASVSNPIHDNFTQWSS